MDWSNLVDELDLWAAAGRRASLWWRDDDAVAPSPALDRLLDLAARARVPVALAVIPADAVPALGAAAVRHGACVLQHGWAHRNHAPAGEKRCEIGAHRGADAVLAELRRGLERLAALAGDALAPVLVPPWNRIDPALVAALPGLGLAGLSTFAPRAAASPAPGLRQTNCHADPIAWRGTRGYAGDAAVLGALVGHLAGRRAGTVDADEPTGVLTHHLVHDDGCWTFLERLLEHTRAHPGARWLDARAAVLAA